MKLTKNFNLSEFTQNRWATKNEQRRIDGDVNIEIVANIKELAENLQALRDHLNAGVTINIGFRPKWWEIERGRPGTSQHIHG